MSTISGFRVYHVNTSEMPSELWRENFISSHVKIDYHRRYGYIVNRAFFTGVYVVYIINRILYMLARGYEFYLVACCVVLLRSLVRYRVEH